MTIYCDLLLLLIIALAAGFDLKKQQIPNLLSFSVIIPAVCKMIVNPFRYADLAIGFAIPLLLFGIPFFINGAVGGGDLKLASMCGLYLGSKGVLSMLFTGMVLCVLSALAVMAIRRSRIKRMPFAPFILAGTAHFLLFAYLP